MCTFDKEIYKGCFVKKKKYLVYSSKSLSPGLSGRLVHRSGVTRPQLRTGSAPYKAGWDFSLLLGQLSSKRRMQPGVCVCERAGHAFGREGNTAAEGESDRSIFRFLRIAFFFFSFLKKSSP
uniref:Uncharacterized protein n=1 Tax=Sphaerodactylus townsendi TaxID=933632 RepID=A0ACB8E530_9SAUR